MTIRSFHSSTRVFLTRLIPNARLEMFDCGHLFLLTRLERSVAIDRRLFSRNESTRDRRTHRIERIGALTQRVRDT